MRFFRNVLIASALLAGTSTAVYAAPYSISTTTTLAVSSIAGINAAQNYTVTFVFDNGGATANSQTWASAHLKCTIWTFNTAQNVVFKQNLAAVPPFSVTGSATTNGAGALTANFSQIFAINLALPNYSIAGTVLTGNVNWFANNSNQIFNDNAGSLSSTGGIGVPMAFGVWTNPQPFVGDCNGVQLGAPPPVLTPTLSEWAMILFTLLLVGFGLRMQRGRGF